MIERVQSILVKYTILLKNMLSMMVLRGAEYVVALISMPYLVRVLGPERFGTLIFMQSVIQYYNIIIDYGFNLTASRDIAKTKNLDSISAIFSSVMCAKIILFIVCCIMTAFIIAINLRMSIIPIDYKLFCAVFLNVIGTMIFPIWFFQGIQMMGYIAKCKLISIVVTTTGIFMFVRGPEDYVLAGFLQAITMLVTGLLSWAIILIQYRTILRKTNIAEIKSRFIEGWQIFISTLFVNIYTNSNLVLLRFFTTDYIVGIFGGASKLIDAIKGLAWPLCQAIYPFICQKYEENRIQFYIFTRKLLEVSTCVGLIIMLNMEFLGQWVVSFLYGPDYQNTVSILQILSVIPAFVFYSIFAGAVLLAANAQNEYSKILMIGSGLDIVMALIMIPLFGANGLAFTMCLVEAFVALKMYIEIRARKRLRI